MAEQVLQKQTVSSKAPSIMCKCQGTTLLISVWEACNEQA